MTPFTQTQTQKEGATEVGTLSLATHSSVSTSGDAMESIASRESLKARVRRFLDAPRARDTEATAHVHALLAANAALERDLVSARTRNATLLRALRRSLEAPVIVGQCTVDGVLTITYANGRVVQCQPTAECTEAATSYGFRWVDLTPLPDTAQAIVEDALTDVIRCPRCDALQSDEARCANCGRHADLEIALDDVDLLRAGAIR
jgi:hypothetical protein